MGKYEDVITLKDKVSETLRKVNKNIETFDKKIKGATTRMQHFQQQTENISKLGAKFKSLGAGMTVGLTLPIVATGGAMIKLASDMEETMNKVDVSFGASAGAVKEWAKSSIKTMGLAQQSALDSAALYGDMATGMGMSRDQASKMAMSLTQLGADLASFKNISNDVAQTALKSIFTGETESLKNLGVVMTETNLQQYAYSKGIRKKIKDMKETEKIQLRYNYVLSQTTNAQGDFIRTGGGAANQTRMFQEQVKELGVTFGTYILPTFTKFITKLNKILIAFGNLSPRTQKIILVLGGLLAIAGPLITVIGTLIGVVSGLSTAFAFLAANPVVLAIAGIVIAIGAVITAVVLLWKNWDKVWNAIKNVTINIIKGITNFINGLLDKLGFLAYFIPVLGAIKIGKNIAGAMNKSGDQNNSFRETSVRNTTNNSTTNNNYYGNIMMGGNDYIGSIAGSSSRFAGAY